MASVIKVERNGVLFLVIDRERLVDDMSLQGVQREIMEVLDRGESRVVLDLSRISFVSSAALGMLVRFRKRRSDHGLTLKMCGVGTMIEETFHITGMSLLFEIYKTAEEAIASFDQQ
ncbi:MAG: STAS domain-containing protein [Pirellulaceae bacterium]|nr:STAS domain-containing protein [Pirellulaceae bacterium]